MSETDGLLWDDMVSALNGLENALRATADDMVKANAEFAASSGLTAKIVRSTSGECCPWCSSIAGTYTYGSEPKDVYRRHNNCDCTVEYVTSKGSQNVHSKQWSKASQNQDAISERKKIGLGDSLQVEGVGKCSISNQKHKFNGGEFPATVYTTPDGTEFIFKYGMDPSDQTMTPEFAIQNWYEVPDSVRSKAQRKICFVDYENPDDAYWRKEYKDFTSSYAIGGDEITFYRYSSQHDADYLIKTYCHEAGHYIDYTIPGSSKTDRYCQQKEWQDAVIQDIIHSGRASITEYGENSDAEDFAESVAYYVNDRSEFMKVMPNRTKLLDKIFSG